MTSHARAVARFPAALGRGGGVWERARYEYWKENENDLPLGNSSFPAGQRIPAWLETKIEWIDLFTSARHRAPVVWRTEGMTDCPPIPPWSALRGEKSAFRVRAASVDGDALMVGSDYYGMATRRP